MAKILSNKTVLVTGGAGYIGSHIVQRLLQEDAQVVVLDNLSTGIRESIPAGVSFIEGDVRDTSVLGRIFAEYTISLVIHMAAKLLVHESVEQPLEYFQTNVGGAMALVEALRGRGSIPVVFSSTAATYGSPQQSPIPETHPREPVNPYGASKLAAEQIFMAAERAYGIRCLRLRYFNVGGTWDDTHSICRVSRYTSHLLPAIFGAMTGERPPLAIHGTDYPTSDGTCVRDYVHVLDIAEAHLLAATYLLAGNAGAVVNIGSGKGFTVREIIQRVEAVCGRSVPVEEGSRRAGDPPELVAANAQAYALLGWKPHYSLDQIIASEWNTRCG